MRLCQCFLWLLIVPLILTGCWDRKEINDVAILLLTAIDIGDEPGTLEAHIQIGIPKKIGAGQMTSGGGDKEKPHMALVIKGTNLEEMTMEAERKLSRNLTPSHRRVFIIGESFARQGITRVLDHISRNPKNRLRTFIVVARGTRAASLIESDYSLESTIEEAIREMVVRKMKIPSMLRDFYVASAAPGIEPIAAAYTKTEDGKIAINNVAIFKDLKLVGYVSRNQAMALISILGKDPLGVIQVRLPEMKGSISVQLDQLKVKKKLRIVKESPNFTIQIQASGRVLSNDMNIDLGNPEYMNKLNKAFEDEIRKLYQSLFTKLQTKYKADSAGLGETIYQKEPKFWKKIEKKWPAMYTKQNISFDVKANISQVGITGAPYYLPEDEVKK